MSPAVMSTTGVSPTPRLRVLVADPDPQSRRALHLILRMDHHEVQLASTSVEALNALAGTSPPGVVIVDREMTGADGVGLSYLVRRAARMVPIIVVSARPGDLAPPIDGAFRLPKPVDSQRLRTDVADLLAARA